MDLNLIRSSFKQNTNLICIFICISRSKQSLASDQRFEFDFLEQILAAKNFFFSFETKLATCRRCKKEDIWGHQLRHLAAVSATAATVAAALAAAAAAAADRLGLKSRSRFGALIGSITFVRMAFEKKHSTFFWQIKYNSSLFFVAPWSFWAQIKRIRGSFWAN